MGKEKRKLPEGWVTIKMDELMVKTPSVNPANRPTNKYELWSVPAFPTDAPEYVQGEDVGSNKQIVQPGDVLLCKINPRINRVWLVREKTDYDQIASTEWIVLRCNELLPEFIMYLLREEGFRHRLCADLSGIGGSLTRARPRIVGKLEIDLSPLNEQKRIAGKIEELQARSRRAREALETIPDLLEQLRQSILAAAFRGDLTKEWRKRHQGLEPASELLKRIRIERRKRWEAAELDKLKAKGLSGNKLDEAFAKQRKKYKEPVPVDTSDLPELPEGWCWTNLDELKRYSIYGPRFSNERYSAQGTFVLRTTDIDDSGRVNIESAPRIVLTQNEFKKYLIKVGDLLITRTGSIGTLAVFNDKVEAIPGAYLLHYRLVLKTGLSWFIFHQLKSPRCQEAMTGGSTGTGRPNLNAPNLESIPLALPPPEEQERILNILDSEIGSIESAMDKAAGLIEKCDIFDKSTLSKAFRGQLVPQDPKDEPASVLLERIRGEKGREAVKQKPRDKRKGIEMKKKKDEQKEVLVVLRGASRAMTPEEVFLLGGFEEDSVDAFYEQLRKAVVSKQVREMREGDLIQLEAIGK